MKYKTNWKVFLDTFYFVVDLKLREINKWLDALTDNTSSFKNLNGRLLKETFVQDYFSEYLDTTIAVPDLDLAIRDFITTINIFFIAIDWVIKSDKKTWNEIITHYHLNKSLVEDLVDTFVFIIAGAGITDLQSLPKVIKHGKKNPNT